MKRHCVTVLALVLALCHPVLAESFQGRVVAITDGDTIRVLRGKEQIRVRLHGIDAPERKQAFGTRAWQYAGELAHEKVVRVEVKNLDRNGRTVGVVFLPDGRNLNHELVRVGLAWWFSRYAPRDQDLARLEREARNAKRGLWADASPVKVSELRALKQNNLRMSVVSRIRVSQNARKYDFSRYLREGSAELDRSACPEF